MQNQDEVELAQVQRALLVVVLLDALGATLVGFGLFGVFAAGGDELTDPPIDPNLAFYAIAFGAAIMLWSLIRIIRLLKRKAELARMLGS